MHVYDVRVRVCVCVNAWNTLTVKMIKDFDNANFLERWKNYNRIVSSTIFMSNVFVMATEKIKMFRNQTSDEGINEIKKFACFAPRPH